MKISIKYLIISIVSLALFMDALDTTIINTAIPAMSHSLGVNPVDLKIALISYLLSLAIFIPISGWIADKFGIKQVFIGALGVFTLSSLWCGYSHSLMELVVARCCQGLGGALMLPLGRLIMLHTFPRHELVNAMNHVVIIISLGLMLGPAAGGYITDNLSWPWIFWVNLPVGLIAIILASLYFKDTSPRHVRPLDTLGFILFGGGLAAITFALSDLSETTANQRQALFILFVGALMLISYILHSRRSRHPIVNTSLFRFRTFRISILGNLICRLSFGAVPFLLPLLLQISLHYSAQLSGLLLVPIAFGIVTVKPIALRLLRRMGYKHLLLMNTILVAFGLFSFAIISATTPATVIAMLTFIYGFLISMQYSGMNSMAYADIEKEDLSSATSIISTTQQISQSFGVAVGAILLRYYSPNGFDFSPTVFHYAFVTMGFLTIFSIFIFMGLQPGDGRQMLNAPEKMAEH